MDHTFSDSDAEGTGESPFVHEVTPGPPAAIETTAVEASPQAGLAPVGTRIAAVNQMNTTPAAPDNANVPATRPVQVVLDPRMLQPVAVPRSMQWTLSQLLQVIGAVGLIALAGLIAGWLFGGTREPVYAARSEFIYFLEDANPDGFLREDRRILTQLVTIESEATLRPLAVEFDTTVEDLRDQLSVEVIDLSEVVRLDITDGDASRALALNQAVLDRYQSIAEQNSQRGDQSSLVDRRDQVLEDLAIADQEAAIIADAELADVSLELREESLRRELDAAVQRADRLSSIADGLLSQTAVVDDRASLDAQISASRTRLRQLESELLSIRSERGDLARAIEVQLASETPYSARSNQERDVTLSVRQDSVQLEIDTVAQRIQSLEAAVAESLLNTTVVPSSEPVEDQFASTTELVADLEEQLLLVSTRRAELAQSASTRPSLTRKVERLEQDLERLDNQLANSALSAERPSPIEVLTDPVVLPEPVGNPKVKWAALGMLASLPVAALCGGLIRRRQRKRM